MMDRDMQNIIFLKNNNELNNFQEQWEDLYNDSDASPYLSYEWVSAALRHFPPAGELFLSCVSDEKGLRAIVPLEIVREKMGPWPVKVVRFALEGWALRNGPIMATRAKGEELSSIINVLEFLIRGGVAWDYCRLSLIPASIMKTILSGKEKRNREIISCIDYANIGSSTVIESPRIWEDYFNGLSKNRRERIRRSGKQLEKKGKVRMVRLGLRKSLDKSELNQLMEDALTISKLSWQGSATAGRAISDEDVDGFFHEVNRISAEKGMVDLSVLYAGDRPVSFCWGMSRWPYTSINKLGYDPSFSESSPGYVHLPRLIADSIERGIKEIDFGHEFSEYKKNWGTRQDELCNTIIYPRGAVPYLIRAMRTIQQKYWKT
jgi:CelD/BcsL family acetyltransferase involved in cellulose biosynthesis